MMALWAIICLEHDLMGLRPIRSCRYMWPKATCTSIGWYYFLILLTNCCVAAIS